MNLRTNYSLLVATLALLASCQKNVSVRVDNPETPGLAYAESTRDFNTTYTSLQSTLKSNPDIRIVAEVNHTANAQGTNAELRPTRVILFGNPNLGTPIMQANQLAGLDLPQKILVYQGADNRVLVAYNTTSYLAARHTGVSGAATLPTMATALSNLTKGASMGTITEKANANLIPPAGIVTVVSKSNFATTYSKLRAAIAGNKNLSIVAELDHQANATSVGMTLNPTKLIVFGNPALGTPLMQSAQTMAIDLPQKMLVWEDANRVVRISYNDPMYLATRHGIAGNQETIKAIETALAGLAATAAAQ